ncbi:MAG TPA: glutamyl-tRNA reductase [Thermoleophilia bacterium]|nr:glutamyl-tRNA reductase [Thermoleophilia bacterium]
MHIAAIGVNHKTACLEVRERVALTDAAAQGLLARLLARAELGEAVAVSTCNRTEIYVTGESLPLREAVLEELCVATGVCREDVVESVYYHEDDRAVDHLFAVAASLDSMVLGEAQILHQLKSAYQTAEEAKTTGAVLNKLFRRSFEVGKRVRSETRIGENSLSIASVSVDLARNVFGDLSSRSVLVVGAGEMAELVLTHLKGHGVSHVRVANRTFERAAELAERFDGDAVHYERLLEHLMAVDIVITSTAATQPIIGRKDMERVMKGRKNRPIFLVDIAVPRDVEATVNGVYNAYLYDIDDLQEVVASNLGERKQEAATAREIVSEEVEAFRAWLRSLQVVPTMVDLRRWATGVKDEELERYLARMPDLTEDQREKVAALAHSLVNKLLHPPTVRVKEAASEGSGYRYSESLRELFGLDEQPRAADPPPPADAPPVAVASAGTAAAGTERAASGTAGAPPGAAGAPAEHIEERSTS